ncbi:MAG: MarR family transcriptional regulator [Thermoleophilaceae bacterium]|nr:MarR family transcriptional regulator [Thermoleophilaceae bacterium]
MQAPSLAKVTRVDASAEAVAADLGVLMKHMFRTTNREIFSAVEEAGITFTQVKCLGILDELPSPIAIGALSETLGLSVPAISRAVDGLVQRGEVKRTEDPRDRRSKLLTLTAKGRRTFERFAALRFAGLKRFVADMSDEEREALAAGLRPLAGRLSP